MSEQAEDDDKQFEASERKLAQAREKGDIPRSEDLQMASSFAGLVLVLALAGPWVAIAAGDAGMSILSNADRFRDLDGASVFRAVGSMAWPSVILALVPMLAVIVYLTASRSWVIAAEKLEFRLSRVSIVSNAKQKFGRAGLFEFFKRALKMVAVSLLLAYFIKVNLESILASIYLDAGLVSALMGSQIVQFLAIFLALSVVFGGIDFFWQRFEFAERNRMTRKEMTDELKESEGDPHLKADRRRRAQEIATNRMLADVPKADVVIVNPTHFAVALRWDRGKDAAPRCVAKGVDEVAAKIRALAQEHGIPIRHDPPTARAIYAVTDVGQEIRVDQYRAVAAAIRFADTMRKRARRR